MGMTSTTDTKVKMPFTIRDVKEVDDNGGVHFEAVLTGGLLLQLHKDKLLQLTGNIRPDHAKDKLAKTNKTRVKIEKWTEELLAGESIIGNISIRANPDKVDLSVEYDEDGRHSNLVIDRGVLANKDDGVFDVAVDSESRLKAILAAGGNPFGEDVLKQRFAVRIWILRDNATDKVAVLFNTRGDKVNDSTAKFSWAENKPQELARRLVKGSRHLGTTNIEVMTNSVSANSHKLTAFNTISKALERRWKGADQSISEAELDAQASWLVSAWDSLVQVRPEFGVLNLPDRQAARKDLVSSTAVVIAGMLDALSTMHIQKVDPAIAFKQLAKQTDGSVDVFSRLNPAWEDAGVVIVNKIDPEEEAKRRAANPNAKPKVPWTSRNSYAARDNAAKVLKDAMGLNEAERCDRTGQDINE